MHRTQITLTDTQYQRLRDESARTGRSLAELTRRALDERYGSISTRERLRLLDVAFGGWRRLEEGGEQFVERLRTGAEPRRRSG
jgi:hypothetical protein